MVPGGHDGDSQNTLEAAWRKPLEPGERLLELVAAVLLLAAFAWVAAWWPHLPDRVPIHFNLRGEPDGFAGRSSLGLLLEVVGLIYGLLTVVTYLLASLLNWPVEPRPETALRMTRASRYLLRGLKVLVMGMFLHLTVGVTAVAMGWWTGLTPWFYLWVVGVVGWVVGGCTWIYRAGRAQPPSPAVLRAGEALPDVIDFPAARSKILMALTAIPPLIPLYLALRGDEMAIVGFIALGPYLAVIGMTFWRPSYYRITPTHLQIRVGLMDFDVPLARIRRVRPTWNPAASAALALRRVAVETDRGETVLVSPADRETFLEVLRRRCPQAEVKTR
ncbi:PH domain-containing protein [Thermaerobacter marianensis]|uniref:PH domain-containing protein n=1 Tax=Thermaerobacter marianensis TaxID=73919 RepID=UPI000307E667|nr:PH domain-containing protein [Thermaerobacter marianensis]